RRPISHPGKVTDCSPRIASITGPQEAAWRDLDLHGKGPGLRPGLRCPVDTGRDQKSIPPIPPPPGMGGAAAGFFGTAATIASVVMRRPATDEAPCRAWRTTLVGSMMPFDIMFTYSPVCASKP